MDYELQAGKNFAWSAFSQLFLRILGLAFFVFMSHFLGDEGMGQYGFISSFVVMWFIFLDFGASGHLYREWSKSPKKFEQIEDDFFSIFSLRLFTVFIIIIPFLIVNYYTNYSIFLAVVLFFISTFIATYINLVDSYFQSLNLFKYPSIRQIIEKVVIITLGSIGLLFWRKVEMVFLAMLLSQVASLIYYFKTVFPLKFKFIFNKQRLLSMVRQGLPFLFLTLFSSLYSRIDIVMLRYMTEFKVVGWYGTAYKFLDAVSILPVLLIPSVFPILSSLWNDSDSKKMFALFFNKMIRILFSIGLIITLIVIFIAPLLVKWLFPESFSPSVLALRIFILSQIVTALCMLFNSLLVIQHREYYSLYIIIFGAILNIGLNLLLIPKFSLYGAAWATVISEVFNLLLLQYFSFWKKDYKVIISMLFISLINLVVLFCLKLLGQLNNYSIGILVVLINSIIIYYTKMMTKDDFIFFFNPILIKLKSFYPSSSEVII